MANILDVVEENVNNRQQSLALKYYDFVAVIGVGGIGSWVALNLALTGQVSNLCLIDPDIVEDTNLNRTPFRIADIGSYKVDALESLILERRLDANRLYTFKDKWPICLERTPTCIIDCRDDLYDDYPDYVKVYKVGYDGLEITIDGNPRETKVIGESNGYMVTPSFICSSQLAANLVVNHILMPSYIGLYESENNEYYNDLPTNSYDGDYKLNDVFTFNTANLMFDLYKESKRKLRGDNQ
jgi:hypothetical protein